jgi:gliding motility-associated-like protein
VKKVGLYILTILSLIAVIPATAQILRGQITQPGSSVLDPNGDGFVSKTTAGFSTTGGYWIPEFEIPMFGIPKLGGDVLGDNVGKSCGITDLIPDSLAYSVYAVKDANNNLIFRFRVGDDNPSVEAWTILLDTDGLFGIGVDPNANAENPGFEIDISLIKNANFGVVVYNIDGSSSCSPAVLSYPFGSHFQISVADEVSCGDPDYFYDFYVPFADLADEFNIDINTGVRMAAVTNVSATCAMGGNISDISGVDNDDPEYKNCDACAFSDLVNNQCPTALSNLCETCTGFAGELINRPTIDEPVRAGQITITGTADPNIYIVLKVYSRIGGTDTSPIWGATPREQLGAYAAINRAWSITLTDSLQAWDKIVAQAQKDENTVPCGGDGGNTATTSVTVVQPNARPAANDQTVDVTEDIAKVITLSGSDSDNDPLIYTVNTPPSHGTLSGITGQNITYTPALNYVGSDSFNFTVSDGIYISVGVVTINVIASNDAPIISGSSTPATFSTSPLVIDNAINITDVDDTQMVGAVISISSNFLSSEDVLLFTNQNGITGSYNAATGVLTLTGTTSIANYTTALASIRYNNTNSTPSTASRQISFVVNDGPLNSNTHIRSITVIDINDPPVIVDDNNNGIDTLFYTIDEDTQLDTCINAVDLDGDLVVINAITNLTGNGSNPTFSGLCFGYLPDPNYSGQEILRIIVSDQRNPGAGTDTAIAIITITQVNDPPIISGTSAPASFVNIPVIIDNTIGLTDIDDTQMESAVVSISGNFIASEDVLLFTNQNDITGSYNAATGVLTLSGTSSIANYISALRSITYNNVDVTPTKITRQVTFFVNDGSNNSNVYTQSITLSNVNTPPVVVDDNNNPIDTIYYTIMEDAVLDTCINAVDADGDLLAIDTLIRLTDNGLGTIVTQTGGLCFQYAPHQNFNSNDFGDEIIRVIITDLRTPAGTDTVIAIINVISVNDPPVITGPGAALTFSNAPVLFNSISIDDDDYDNTSAPIVSAVISITGNFHPSEDALLFTNQNGISGNYNALTGVLTLSGLSNIADYATALSSIRYVNLDATPSTATRQVSFMVNDGIDNSNTYIRSITVEDINDPPVIVDDNNSDIDTLYYTINEDAQLDTLISALDLDGDIVEIDTIVNLTSNGDALAFPNLHFTYAPDVNYFGEERLLIIVTDSRSPVAGLDTAFVVIQIDAVNDPPVLNETANAVTFNELPIVIQNTLTITDIDDTNMESATISITGNFQSSEDALQFTNQNGITGNYNAANGVLTLSGSASIANYTTAIASVQYFNPDQTPTTLTREVSFIVNDGGDNSNVKTVEIFIVPLNELEIDTVQLLLGLEDTARPICLLGNDPEGDTIIYSNPVNIYGGGSPLTPGSEFGFCQYTFENDVLNYNGLSIWTVMACDGGSPSICKQIRLEITIRPVNDPPVALDDYRNAQSGTLITYSDLMDNDLTIEAPYQEFYDIYEADSTDTLTIDNLQAYNGTATINVDGGIDYRPNREFMGTDSIRYWIRDSGDSIATALVIIEVGPPPFHIYNAISPGDNNLNEYWRIDGIEEFPNNVVKIFDRFNNLVYEASGYRNKTSNNETTNAEPNYWYGQSNHGLAKNSLPEGTYFYSILLGDGSKPIGGYIVLKRK